MNKERLNGLSNEITLINDFEGSRDCYINEIEKLAFKTERNRNGILILYIKSSLKNKLK